MLNHPNLPKLAELLREQSQTHNLFSKGDRDKLESKHFPDALAVLDFWEIKPGLRVLDIGTGGGIPGLVLASVRPDLDFTLLDSTQKKLRAVDAVISSLGLTNVRTVWGRAEALSLDKNYRGRFDVVTARAVAALPQLLEWVKDFLKPGGHFYAWKSRDYNKERDEGLERQMGFHLEGVFDYTLPEGEERSILDFKKHA